MSFVNSEFVERYQLLYQKDPRSKVFAPLGEAYRKLGLLDAALEVCTRGVEIHPHFPSGRVALAKILIDRADYAKAIEQLNQATELSPENLLAHSLTGETYLKLRRPKDALKAFKMVLFLNPQDKKAAAVVQKLESLTADEYEDELFQGAQVTQVATPDKKPLVDRMRSLERFLSLADAFIVRNDLEKALDTLKKASAQLGQHPEIHSRLELLLQREQEDLEAAEPLRPLKSGKRQRLESLLHRINSRRFDRRSLSR